MIRHLLKVERGTIVHFLKWGLALLAVVIGLWLALTLLGSFASSRTFSGLMGQLTTAATLS